MEGRGRGSLKPASVASQDYSVRPPSQINNQKLEKKEKHCALLKQRGREGRERVGKRRRRSEKGKEGEGEERRRKGSGGGGENAENIKVPSRFFPSIPFFIPTVSNFFGLALYFIDSPFSCV